MTATSHLCNHRHKVRGCGLVVQSLTRFDSKDAAVTVDGKLGKRRCLIIAELAEFKLTADTHFIFT